MDLFIVGILMNSNGIDKQNIRSLLKYLRVHQVQIINFWMSGNIIIIVRKDHFQNLFNFLGLHKIQII
ncbi:hypothetical protein GLOIN_2v1718773 [Rhizophagus irregularis DAOM 181602=DAOM 197198]|uniref:Uncharacterized protein n=1 Tax=Rhizophagus irregularis (strain DAOM 181602 / DAOM 197198 / MUCL 43194) TaxID=747089 RepID=A0A2P4P371_RHIID|nr:hypothetical protein GLOIN_2v1718773 [Rhizophagus irregularis DAOM 181602=DAOM 197198]POG59837.1 hypothetical protein GLOIN_2v1718773 [Rhizophagus irregularis DAOM 181602=DAOM 197198]|eukprot:XP_025166703.1 hypothetical protein GLOIN_2v1718773 [Rhizophagus irregularis DAOM 181602=DAOM 197198]